MVLKRLLIPLCLFAMAGAFQAQAEEEQQGPAAPSVLNLSSLMYSQTDISNLMKVIQAKELYDGNPFEALKSADMQDTEILQELQRRALKEQEDKRLETTMPDLYVSSIVYRAQNDWAVWLRKHRFEPLAEVQIQTPSNAQEMLTQSPDVTAAALQQLSEGGIARAIGSDVIVLNAARNEGDNGRVRITAIDNDRVTLTYKPDAALAALKRFRNKDQETPRLKQFANRVTPSAISYDENANLFSVTLRANQTFSLNMMRVVEGRTVTKISQPDVAPIAPAAVVSGATANDAQPVFDAGNSLEGQAANKLIGDMQKIQQYLPTNQMK